MRPEKANSSDITNPSVDGIDAETDARLRQAAALLIDEFLRIDSMKDNDDF